jgi:hypothetical protein
MGLKLAATFSFPLLFPEPPLFPQPVREIITKAVNNKAQNCFLFITIPVLNQLQIICI